MSRQSASVIDLASSPVGIEPRLRPVPGGGGAARAVVVGGGIAGLAAAHHLWRRTREAGERLELTLLEAAPRFGGKIVSHRRDGFLLEGGPDSFITRKPEALELVRELGLIGSLIDTRPEHRRLAILTRGKPVELPADSAFLVPAGWRGILGSPVLSWRGRLRLALDLVLPPRRAEGDESLAGFIERRLGREALERLVGPLLAGIHATEPEELSLLATFPRLAALERRHGSVLAGLRAARAGHPSPAAARASLAGGLGELVEALVAELAAGPGVTLACGRGARRIAAAAGGGYRVEVDGGKMLAADAVVLAVPAFAAAGLVAELSPRLAAGLGEIRYASTAVISLGFDRARVGDLVGYGLLVPRAEGRWITACTFTSNKLAHRAPAGSVLLRAFAGGPRHEGLVRLGDDALVALARRELGEILGLTAEPVVARVDRWPDGSPRYEVGHLERVAALEEALPPGLFLAGSAYHGVGLPDAIASGRRSAAGVARYLASRPAAAMARGSA